MKNIILLVVFSLSVSAYASSVVTKKCVETAESRENLDFSYDIEISQSELKSIHMVIYNLAGQKENLAFARLNMSQYKKNMSQYKKNKSLKYIENQYAFGTEGKAIVTLNKSLDSVGPVKMTVEGYSISGADEGPTMVLYKIAELVCE